jgi:tagatose 1,6-diphosphate aldolase
MNAAAHPSNLGKRWGLRRMADANGHFLMLAVDQRPPLMALIARARGCPPEQVTYADMVAAKRLLAEELAPFATATLVDPNFAYPAAIAALPADRGLIVTLEEHRFRETEGGRRSAAIPGWSVDRIKGIGADGVKLLIYYRPDAAPDVVAHQQQFVRAVGRDCRACDIPLVLELLVYPLAGATANHQQAVLASAAEFAQPHYAIDLLKLESPLPAAELPADDRVGEATVQAAFDALGRAAGALPWVLLSGGAGKDAFRRLLRAACRAGASGFLAGRSIWAEAMAAFPDLARCRGGLRENAVPYMRELAAVVAAEGHAWRADYQDLAGIDREGAFAAAVPALGNHSPGSGPAAGDGST